MAMIKKKFMTYGCVLLILSTFAIVLCLVLAHPSREVLWTYPSSGQESPTSVHAEFAVIEVPPYFFLLILSSLTGITLLIVGLMKHV
jgi:hypothetical protein